MSDISELFARDPLSLSDQDINQVIEFYRKARANFVLTGTSRTPKAQADAPKVDLSSLQLDL